MQAVRKLSGVVALALAITSFVAMSAFAQGAPPNPTGGTRCVGYNGNLEGGGSAPTAATLFSTTLNVRFWVGLTVYRLFAPMWAPSRVTFAPSRLVARRAIR